jgi:aromatic ring hydroxylase
MIQTVHLKFDFNQLLAMVEQCNINQKMAIIKALEKDTYKARFKQLLDELKENDLTPDEVTTEVELVRKKRYNAKGPKK